MLKKNHTPLFVGSFCNSKAFRNELSIAAKSNHPVLITGETGTGKELIAETIHKLRNEESSIYKIINCGAVPDSLLESELFGHEKGAFTGASEKKKGAFEFADKGTLFLDEIGDMPLNQQTALLRLVENKHFCRVGSHKNIQLNAKIISATNRDLKKESVSGSFRKDLYYRLSYITIYLPSLRERREDIIPLAQHFYQEAIFQHQICNPPELTLEILKFLYNHQYTGNIRELRNIVTQYVLQNKNPLSIETDHRSLLEITEDFNNIRPFDYYKKRILIRYLNKCNGNKARAAKELGIGRSTLFNMIRKYQLNTQNKSKRQAL